MAAARSRTTVTTGDVVGGLAGAVVLGVSWWKATHPTISPLEERALRAANGAPARAYPVVAGVMQVGSFGGPWAVAGVLWRRGRRPAAAATAAAGTASWLGAKLVKRAVGRGRPADHVAGVTIRGAAQTGLGFPSGHAAVSASVAVVAGRVLPRPLRLLLVVAAGVTAFARVYVGAHLPLDVVGGAGLGVVAGSATRVVARLASGAR